MFHKPVDYENFNILDDAAFHMYINNPLEIIGMIVWLVLIWRGTKIEKFFSN